MDITYSDSLTGVTAEKLSGFFVGWPQPPSPETHLRLLRTSDEIVLAREGPDGKVVGFITAITDRVLSAYLPLIEVLPEYQHRGIAGELMRRMLGKLDGLYMIDLVCDAELVPFYERFGLKPAPAMVRRDFRRQSGDG
jgi:ribosomal protein S18 acetylase RimI-like enzyme